MFTTIFIRPGIPIFLSQMNLIHAISPYSLQFYFSIILPNNYKWFLPSGFPTKTLYVCFCSLALVHNTYPAHLILLEFSTTIIYGCRSHWSRGLRGRSAGSRLLRLWVRIPPRKWMFVVSVLYYQVEVSAAG